MTIADLNTLCRNLCSANTTTLSAANLLIYVNQAYEEVASWILNADGLWQWDDENFTTFPIGTATLVDSQNDYGFASDVLDVEKVGVLDSSGNEYFLDPVDPSDTNEPLTVTYKNDGVPLYYDKQGSSVVLYPAPSTGAVTLTNGLKVYFKRTADVFTSAQVSTGTKKPGFASPFHHILSYMSAIPFCIEFKPKRVAALELKVQQLKAGIEAHYGKREQDRRKLLDNAPIQGGFR